MTARKKTTEPQVQPENENNAPPTHAAVPIDLVQEIASTLQRKVIWEDSNPILVKLAQCPTFNIDSNG